MVYMVFDYYVDFWKKNISEMYYQCNTLFSHLALRHIPWFSHLALGFTFSVSGLLHLTVLFTFSVDFTFSGATIGLGTRYVGPFSSQEYVIYYVYPNSAFSVGITR